MKKVEILKRINDALKEHVTLLNDFNNGKDPDDHYDYQTISEAAEAVNIFEKLYDDYTGLKDTDGADILIGHEIDILASNMYDGLVNLNHGKVCLETIFFNKPLIDHLQAADLEHAHIREPYNTIRTDDDDLPF